MITQREIARKDFDRVCELNNYEMFTEKQVQGYISHVKSIIQKSEVENLSEGEIESINTFNEDLPEIHKAIVLNDDLSRELVFYRERKVIFEDSIEKSEGTDIEKAIRTGRYANTYQNRKLNRVGQKYVERKKKVGTEEEEKKGKNNVWSKDQEGKVAQNDKEFQDYLKKEGIDRYSKEAFDAWKQGSFRDKQRGIFGKDKKEGKSKMLESQKKNNHDLVLRSDFSVSLGADKQIRFMKKYIQQAVDSFKEHYNIKESDVGILGMLDEIEKIESTKEGKRLMDFYSKQGEIESKMNKLISQLGDLERDAVRLANEL